MWRLKLILIVKVQLRRHSRALVAVNVVNVHKYIGMTNYSVQVNFFRVIPKGTGFRHHPVLHG